MNTKDKGRRAKQEIMEYFKARGLKVDDVEKRGRFVKGDRDMFGLFDLVVLDESDVYFIQVTCNTPHTHYLYKQFAFNYPAVRIEQWVKYDRQGWRRFIYNADGTHDLASIPILNDGVKTP